MTKVPEDLYFPAFWFEAQGLITEESAGVVIKLFDLPQIASLIGVAVSLLCLSGIILSLFLAQKNKQFEAVPTKDCEKPIIKKDCDQSLLKQ